MNNQNQNQDENMNTNAFANEQMMTNSEEIMSIMNNRRTRQDELARNRIEGTLDSNMRNDNDSNIVDRNNILTNENNNNNNRNNNNFMALFDENYYLDNKRYQKEALPDNISMMNANGSVNEDMVDNRKISRSELLKKKALDLETLIVDRITRDKIDDAMRVFSVLEKMHRKYDDDIVSDIYYRVLQSLPEKEVRRANIYSYRQNKNNFKEVLNQLNTQDNIKAFNEESPCINSLGEMWEECDINICSQKCKKKIMDAKSIMEDDENKCNTLITGHKDGKDIKMKDDIKDLILQRLKYCKKISDMKKGNYEIMSYTDKVDLKNKTIKDIQKMARLANMHYNSCHDKASEFFSEDAKYKSILNVLKNIDFNNLSLERLQELRNDLTMLPTCDMLKFKKHDSNREDDVKDGIRVGKYIIPKKTDYYDQIKGKDRPFVYRDIATDKHYLYDSYSKTLTGFEYPMSEEALKSQLKNNEYYDKKKVYNTAPNPSFIDELYEVDFKVPGPSEISESLETPSPSLEENQNKLENDLESNDKILFNLSFKQIIEYLFLILIIFCILLAFSALV